MRLGQRPEADFPGYVFVFDLLGIVLAWAARHVTSYEARKSAAIRSSACQSSISSSSLALVNA